MPLFAGFLTQPTDTSGSAITSTGPKSVTFYPGVSLSYEQLTSGSDLNRAATPWRKILDAGIKMFTAWVPNSLKPIWTINTPANYGSVSSIANYGFRWPEYGAGAKPFGRLIQSAGVGGTSVIRSLTAVASPPLGGIGNYPTIRDPTRPEYNNLQGVVYNLRVVDPNVAQAADLLQYQVIQVGPTDFTPTGGAQLKGGLL